MGGAFLCLLAAFPFLSGQKKTAPARRRRTMYHSGGADGPHFVPHRGQSAGHLPLRISRMLFQPGFQGVDDDRAEVIIAGLAEVPGHILARMQHGGAHAAVIALPASLFPARDDLGRRVGIPIRPSPALRAGRRLPRRRDGYTGRSRADAPATAPRLFSPRADGQFPPAVQRGQQLRDQRAQR